MRAIGRPNQPACPSDDELALVFQFGQWLIGIKPQQQRIAAKLHTNKNGLFLWIRSRVCLVDNSSPNVT